MAPALTEAAGQAQKLKLKLPFEPPTTIPSSRLIAPTRTYRRNNNNNHKAENADTLEKLLLACPVADIEFDEDDDDSGSGCGGGKGRDGDVFSKAAEAKKAMAATAKESRVSVAGTPSSPSCTQCKPTVNGGPVIGNKDCTTAVASAGGGIQRTDQTHSRSKAMCTSRRWPKAETASEQEPGLLPSRSLAEKTLVRERFQEKLERRALRLVRRMCRLRVAQASHHVSRQLMEFVCHQCRIPISGTVQTKHPLLDALLTEGTTRSSSMSTSSSRHDYDARSLFRRLESSHNENRLGRVGGGAAGAATTTAAAAAVTLPVLPDKLDPTMCDHMERTCGSLLTDIGYLDRELDSDATASSSGGESYDELEDDEDADCDVDRRVIRPSVATPVQKRAFWKWAVDRAAVVSRWTWLQAQVSDLEYRIRQTSEIHRQLRRVKDSAASSSASNKSSSQVNGFVSKGGGGGGSSSGSDLGGDGGGCCRTRCLPRPLIKRLLVRSAAATASSLALRGRQPPMSNRRSTRPTTVRCSCIGPPSSPTFSPSSSAVASSLLAQGCVLCGGRMMSTAVAAMQTVDATMPRSDRVALLDPSFHSVLSFPRDTSLAIHFEAVLKNNEHGKLFSKAKGVNGVKKKARALQINDHTRKKCRKLKKNATVTLTARLRKISKGRTVSNRKTSHSSDGNQQLQKRPKRTSTSRRRNDSNSSGCSSQNASPVPSPELGDNSSSQASGNSAWGLVMTDSRRGSGSGGVSVSILEALRRKRGESEYDIDNIVIPYSMAASTRVERLQYKEILTPKWRAVSECDAAEPDVGSAVREAAGQRRQLQQQENGISDEDVSESAVIQRHDVCELSEKKRFLGYMKNIKPGIGGGGGGGLLGVAAGSSGGGVLATPNMTAASVTVARRTRSMRSDSRADSSGANTPDPLSPQASIAADIDSTLLLAPPPSGTPFNNNNNYNIDVDSGASPSKHPSHLQERRRTTSLSKRDRLLDDVRVSTPTTLTTTAAAAAAVEVTPSEPYVPVTPWEPRTFPLQDHIYDEMVQEGSKHTCLNLRFTRLSSGSGIPESEWNGSAMTTTTASAAAAAATAPSASPPPLPVSSRLLNHVEAMDCCENANLSAAELHHSDVK